MSDRNLLFVILIGMLVFLPGCDIIIGIFKAGFWAAIVLVVLVVGLVIYGYKKYQG